MRRISLSALLLPKWGWTAPGCNVSSRMAEVEREQGTNLEQGERGDAMPSIRLNRVIAYEHSSIIYWWVVWSFGYVCAALSWLRGQDITLENGEVVYLAPGWVGGSFVAVVGGVLFFTNIRIRGWAGYVATVAIACALVALFYYNTWDWMSLRACP